MGTLAAFVVLVLLVGGNVIAVKVTTNELDPFWAAGGRFGLAAMLFVGLAFVRGAARPNRDEWRAAAIYGLIGFGAPFTFIYWGIERTPAGLASVALALVPLLTLFLAVGHGLERFRIGAVAGAVLALIGIALAHEGLADLGVPLPSLLALVAAAACFAETNIVAKRLPRMDPAVINAVAMGVGAVMLLAISLVAGERHILPDATATWVALLYLVTLGSIAVFLLFLLVVRRWAASVVSYEFVLSPIVVVTLGALLLEEPVTPIFVLGATLVIVGVYLGALTTATSVPVTDAAPGSDA